MRLAVAISGQIRTFAANAAALDAMFRAAVGPSGQVDYFGALHAEDWAWVGRWAWTSCVVMQMQVHPDLTGIPIGYPWAAADPAQAMWQAWQGLRAVGALVRLAEEARGGLRYDWICRCRPDMAVITPMEQLEDLAQDAIYAPAHDNWGGVMDRFWFGPSALMEHSFRCGESVAPFFLRPEAPDRDTRCFEVILNWHLRRAGIQVRRSQAIMGTRRMTGEIQQPIWRPDRGDLEEPAATAPNAA
jgi:hypothetical protein